LVAWSFPLAMGEVRRDKGGIMRTLTGLFLFAVPVVAAPPAADFAHEVVPILKKHCVECHSGAKKKGGFSMNTREEFMAGSENGPVAKAFESHGSRLVEVIGASDKDERMPPKGEGLSAEEIAVLTRWVDAGLPWEEGFAFQAAAWEPPLRPSRPELPPVVDGREHPVDRLLDAWMAEKRVARPEPLGDGEFLRRVTLDITGLLPTPEALAAFLADGAPDKRSRVIDGLLADREAYAGHWISFWNDLLRNDYAGTGYIDGGRSQITGWLYAALLGNKPYDVFARELIAPTAESEGFSRGIKWRGAVSAGQVVPVQFAQSVGQVFLGINLKCASCHDSFIDRWKLSDAYGLAAIYADQPLELHRCDVPTGKQAVAAWLFPEIGQVDAKLPRDERLKQLAGLMTHPENGRFTRTIVNRMWHRLTGAGIVHPVDAMQTPPWHAGLLDWLASEFAATGYDLQKLIRLICTSQAYQSRAAALAGEGTPEWRGPRARRMTAEQFVDAVWRLTGTAPAKADASIPRAAGGGAAAGPGAAWVWSSDGVKEPHASGQTIALRHRFTLAAVPEKAVAAVTCDNGFVLFVNGRKVAESGNWEQPVGLAELPLKAGENEIVAVATNGGSGPNPAGFWFEARLTSAKGELGVVRSGRGWEWTADLPDNDGRWAKEPSKWLPAVAHARQGTWAAVNGTLAEILAGGGGGPVVRASLMKSDLLMRALGRPNREQIVSTRPAELTTLEAMDLNNGAILTGLLERGATQILAKRAWTVAELSDWLYAGALSRKPTEEERLVAGELLGGSPTASSLADLLWAVCMLPEFQLVR
jgi:mono/diheme cytochrome c family protein